MKNLVTEPLFAPDQNLAIDLLTLPARSGFFANIRKIGSISAIQAPVFLVNQRTSENDTARGSERTVLRKPSTWPGKAIS